MKKILSFAFIALLVFTLAACGSTKNDSAEKAGKDGNKKLIVGATAVPHAEVLEAAKPLLKKKVLILKCKCLQIMFFPMLR